MTESGDTFRTLSGVDHLPPTYLQSGTRDLFLSNTVRMHRKLRSSGVHAELHIGEAMPHGGFGGAPENLELDAEAGRFIAGHVRHGRGG
ncbi:alpha/beta hydrolase [Streptomyces acidiscabies]|uniref:alpha/beta hydrolase n=1 Tax=Streptomyces acidiscabies TaxID=42234 RepID=UPI00193093F1|nr:alpha/beta hydrolase fold domain-containing protein [Streptomyces acidiscabies]MBZ3916625.1 alpha/beta hydrolase fold domain-containing protein [Streptomyces acidiscabies]